jgi:hypothetical protein
MFLVDFTNGYLLLADVPESLALLVFGAGLMGAAFALRRLLKRYDEGHAEDAKAKVKR